MADIYEMPTPKPPSDEELDRLTAAATRWMDSVEVTADARQVIRVQARVIKALRVALAQAQTRAENIQVVADMRRDMEVAAYAIDQVTSDCPGVGTPPLSDPTTEVLQGRVGICSICKAYAALDGEVIGEHTYVPGPPVRAT